LEEFEIKLQEIIQTTMETSEIDHFLQFKNEFGEQFHAFKEFFGKLASHTEKLEKVEMILVQKVEEKRKSIELEKKTKMEKATSFIDDFITQNKI